MKSPILKEMEDKGATVNSYGIHVFPHTVIVDREGKIAATTRPDEVTEAALADVVAGKKIDLPVKSNKSADTDWDTEFGLNPDDATTGG